MNSARRVLLLLKPSPARESLSRLLEEQGLEVTAQASTFRAVSGLAKCPSDVVIVGLDDLLDEEFEVVRIIREECPGVFIILTFTPVNRRKAQTVLGMGADCYVLEPLKPEEVAAALRHLSSPPAQAAPPDKPLTPEEVEFIASSLAEEEPSAGVQPDLAAKKPDENEFRPSAHGNGFPTREQPQVEVPPQPPAVTRVDTGVAPDRLASLRKLGASVAHEINNPLTTLSGWIQLLLKKANGNQDLRRTLVNMKEETDRIADVVRELSAISEPDLAGRGPVDINTFAEAVIECFVNTNGHDKVRVKKIFTPDPPRVKVDRELLVRAVCDLLNSRYLDLGNSGSLVFTTLTTPEWVELHVYEPGSQVNLKSFQQALDSVNLEAGDEIGQDLMLARCQEIVGSHGGAFAAECDPRDGLSFQLKLPREK
jgi:DNA-binding NarL/FixJ family response regulator